VFQDVSGVKVPQYYAVYFDKAVLTSVLLPASKILFPPGQLTCQRLSPAGLHLEIDGEIDAANAGSPFANV
jgi:hypothetical protein